LAITSGADGNLWLSDQGTTEAIARLVIGGPVNTILPTVTGTAAQGSTLTIATTGAWTGTPTPTISSTYQWKRCNTSGANCTTISGATNSTYVLTAAEIGSTIRGAVSATNTLGTAKVASAQTGVVT
jgi:hypothetical protein